MQGSSHFVWTITETILVVKYIHYGKSPNGQPRSTRQQLVSPDAKHNLESQTENVNGIFCHEFQVKPSVRCSEHRVVACRSVHVAAGRISRRCMAGACIAIVSAFAIFYFAVSIISASFELGFTIFVRDLFTLRREVRTAVTAAVRLSFVSRPVFRSLAKPSEPRKSTFFDHQSPHLQNSSL